MRPRKPGTDLGGEEVWDWLLSWAEYVVVIAQGTTPLIVYTVCTDEPSHFSQ